MADLVVLYGDKAPFKLQTVRTFLACAWLCFVLALAVAGYTSSIMTLTESGKLGGIAGSMGWSWKWELGGIVIAAMLHLLLLTGFCCLSLAMAAYVGVVGWVAVGFCAAAVVFVVSLVTYQVEYGTFGSRALSPVQALRLSMPLAMLKSIPGPIVEAEPLPHPIAQRRP